MKMKDTRIPPSGGYPTATAQTPLQSATPVAAPILQRGAPSPAEEQSARAATGQVTARGAQPAFTIVGNYHQGEKIDGEFRRLLEKGFAADKGGNAAKALEHYAAAFPHLREAVVRDLESKMEGVPGDDLRTRSDLDLAARIGLGGGRDRLDPKLVDDFKIYMNRKGLALNHQQDYGMASFYCTTALGFDPGYGPALYNSACIELKAGANPTSYALDLLEKAVASDPKFFRGLLQNDADWNGLRYTDARFREIAGLA